MTHRSRSRSYLLLARVSNLPTVWTNVLTAYIASMLSIEPVSQADAYAAVSVDKTLPIAALAMTMFYAGGMFLNDAADAKIDAIERPERPIPAADVSRFEALVAGVLLLAGGELILFAMPARGPAMIAGAALAAAIAFYDYRHKGRAFAPVVMGLCRALVYVTVSVATISVIGAPVLITAVVMWVYIIALTWAAKTRGIGDLVPWLLAGICLVDAAMIAAMHQPRLALVAAAGFVVTLAFQRVVPGH